MPTQNSPNQPPVAVLASTTSFTSSETGQARLVLDGLTITDVDNTTLLSASLRFTDWQKGDYFSIVGSIATAEAISINADVGMITMSGLDTLADFQTALRGIAIGSNGAELDETRHLILTLNDGSSDVQALSVDVGVFDTNDSTYKDGGIRLNAGITYMTPLELISSGSINIDTTVIPASLQLNLDAAGSRIYDGTSTSGRVSLSADPVDTWTLFDVNLVFNTSKFEISGGGNLVVSGNVTAGTSATTTTGGVITLISPNGIVSNWNTPAIAETTGFVLAANISSLSIFTATTQRIEDVSVALPNIFAFDLENWLFGSFPTTTEMTLATIGAEIRSANAALESFEHAVIPSSIGSALSRISQTVQGTEGRDLLGGESGDDILKGGAGDDLLVGGQGRDTAIFSGAFSDYSFAFNSLISRFFVIDQRASGDGIDTLVNIERLKFADGVWSNGAFHPGISTDLVAYSWNSHTLLDNVAIRADNTVHLTNGRGTLVVDTNTSSPAVALEIQRDIAANDAASTNSAVDLQDAIAILRMIVGLDANGSGAPTSAFQSIAADFDRNGTVGLTDAIGVLRHVVGLPAPTPQWHFVSELDAATMIPTLNPGIIATSIRAELTHIASQAHVGIVGILAGDVDGSWSGGTGDHTLDAIAPEYLHTLAQNYGINLSQFGIYN